MKTVFGTLPGGQTADLYTLTNAAGMEMTVTNYGGIIVSLKLPGPDGRLADVVLGYDRLDDYLRDPFYLGALIGRYANRIAGGRFVLNGKTYALAANNGPNHLHGGVRGFNRVLWNAAAFENAAGSGVALTYRSSDGEEGYPGNLDCRVIYTLSDDNRLRVDYEAVSDRPTVCSLTQHSYFNLAGHGSGRILDHELMINADAFTPVNERLIPTGELHPVAGSPFDFRQPTAIGARVDQAHPQLQLGRGYDHNWVIRRHSGDALTQIATLRDPASGRSMEVWSDAPGVQFYSGNFLDGSIPGKEGAAYPARSGLCLETQHFPDSPNQPAFPSPALNPGEVYRSTTEYRFRS